MKDVKSKALEFCHDCQLDRGGIAPDEMYVTMWEGICDSCGEKKTIVPSSDYRWPKGEDEYVWD